MKLTIEDVQKYIISLGYHTAVVFVEEIENDCIYFDAINPSGTLVSIRADVENDVSIDKWNIYESCDTYDWETIKSNYQ